MALPMRSGVGSGTTTQAIWAQGRGIQCFPFLYIQALSTQETPKSAGKWTNKEQTFLSVVVRLTQAVPGGLEHQL